ncbi:hypothetical protein JW752_02450 [Candidatus Peregrinibacteria bacterium]|nr:hypothetical protein [Candidatus Peregrinibacteria bacterium]
MDSKKLSEAEDTNLSGFEVVEEKTLDKDWILRKIRFDKKILAYSVRLHLTKAGLRTSNIFGGEAAQFISSKDCDDYFDRIESADDFEILSERVRQQLLMVI